MVAFLILPEHRIVSKRDGVFHEPEPGPVVPVIEVLGRDVLRDLFHLWESVLAKQEGFDVLVEPGLVPQSHSVQVGCLKTFFTYLFG